jgi:hypothetical protein
MKKNLACACGINAMMKTNDSPTNSPTYNHRRLNSQSAFPRPSSSASASPMKKEHLAKGGPLTPQVANKPRSRERFSPKLRRTSESYGNCNSRTTLNEIWGTNSGLEEYKKTMAVDYGVNSDSVCSSSTVGITNVDAQNTCNAFCTESSKSGASSEQSHLNLNNWQFLHVALYTP